MHELYFFLLLLATLSNSVLILLLFKRTFHSPIISTFVLMLLLINCWSIPQLLLISFPFKEDLFIAIDKISDLGYVFVPVLSSLFALAYSNRLSTVKNILYILHVFIPAIIFIYFAWNSNLIESHIFKDIMPTAWGYQVPTGALFPVFFLWFESVVFMSLITIWFTYRNSFSMMRKKQAKLVVIAFIIPMAFGTITNGILPAFNIPIIPMGVPMTSIMALIIAIAIYRYGLFELSSIEILSSIGNGMITINKQKKIVLINDIAADILGYQKEQITEKSFQDVVTIRGVYPNNLSHKETNPIPYVLRTGEKIRAHDFVMKSKHRRTFSIECTINPILHDGEVMGATIIFRDNSKEKAIEKSKNEFISIASHELKTPLTSVIAFSQLLEKNISGKQDKKNSYIIKSINEQLHKMKNLIEDLLDVSRIESGMFVLDRKVYAIDDLIQKAVDDMQYSCNTHEIIKVGRTKKRLLYDVDRVYQVILNLISNAIKYSPHEKKIYVFVKEMENEMVISVQDFGIGIPKRDQVRIFDRFFRSEKGQRKTIAGFGLGLYICSEIIRNHNGRIWVESKEGKGSLFSFALPYNI